MGLRILSDLIQTLQSAFIIGSQFSGGLRKLRFQSLAGTIDIDATPTGADSVVIPAFSGTVLVRASSGAIQAPTLALPAIDTTSGALITLAYGNNSSPATYGNSTWNIAVNSTSTLRFLRVNSAGVQTVPLTLTEAGLLTAQSLTVNPGANTTAQITVAGTAGFNSLLVFQAGGQPRWALGRDGVAEGSSDTGSNFGLYRYNNSGGFIDSPLSVARTNGRVSVVGFGFRNGGFSSFIDQTLTANRTQVIPDQSGTFVLREDSSAFTAGDLLIGRSSGGLARAKLTSTGGVSISEGDGSISLDTADTQVSEFTASGAYTIPTGAKVLILEGFGGGGGGGGGCRRSAGVARPGGSGGNGGRFGHTAIRRSNITGNQLVVTIGSGGLGGFTPTADNSDGVAGSGGGQTLIQDGSGNILLTALGGAGGIPSTGGAASAVPAVILDGLPGGTGGSSTATAVAASASLSMLGAGGGGAGGGINASNSRTNGALGGRGYCLRDFSAGNPGSGGTVGALSGTDGTLHHGGGGASGENAGAVGNGGKGSRGGGGGGGGGCTNGTALTPNGGTGGDGFVRITAVF